MRNVFTSLFRSGRDTAMRKYLLVGALACSADLLTKELAVRVLGPDGLVPLSERFMLMLVWNTGSAGGVSLGPLTTQINVVVTVIALALVSLVVRPLAMVSPSAIRSLALIAGGASGNLLSMVAGPEGVADFIGIRLSAQTTIVANIADFCLWTGAILLMPTVVMLIRLLRQDRSQERRLHTLSATH